MHTISALYQLNNLNVSKCKMADVFIQSNLRCTKGTVYSLYKPWHCYSHYYSISTRLP